MVNLTLTEKGGSTNELSFDKEEVTVGRVRGNDIVLPKGNVSKHHCRLLMRDDEILVEDLRSTNGTYVNGRKIGEPAALSAGDKVFVGDFIIRDCCDGCDAPARASGSPRGWISRLGNSAPRTATAAIPPRRVRGRGTRLRSQGSSAALRPSASAAASPSSHAGQA